jgi:hypothetical protein
VTESLVKNTLKTNTQDFPNSADGFTRGRWGLLFGGFLRMRLINRFGFGMLLLVATLGTGCGPTSSKKKSEPDIQTAFQKRGYAAEEQTQYKNLQDLRRTGGPEKEIFEALGLLKSKNIAISGDSDAAFADVFVAARSLSSEDAAVLISAFTAVLATVELDTVASGAKALQSLVRQPAVTVGNLANALRIGLAKLVGQDSAKIAAYNVLFSRLADNADAISNLNALVDGFTSADSTATVGADALTTFWPFHPCRHQKLLQRLQK